MTSTTDAPGLTRRQVLTRGALVGGAVLATQSLGTVAAHAQTSEPPPPPPPPPPVEPTTGTLPSNFQVLVRYAGMSTTYGVKYDAGWDKIGKGTACSFGQSYQDPPKRLLADLAGSVGVGQDSGGHVAYVLSLPSGIQFVEGRAKDGSCKTKKGGKDKCGAPVQSMGDGTYAFTACD